MFTNPDYSQEERQLVYKKMGELVRENLEQGNNVIYDGNLLSNNERFEIFNRFQSYGKVVFLALAVDFTYSLNRAIAIGNPRDPKHSEHIRRMYQAFEPLDASLPSITIDPGTYEHMESQLKQKLEALD